jgi:carbamoyl-phosphate synthase large subunit
MNVLLTCAGRRNYLVRFFQEALHGCGFVLAADASEHAPAFADADRKFIVPSMDHPDYFDALLRICHEHEVGLIVPVNDLEIEGLARKTPHFLALGTLPVVAPAPIVTLCQDKWAAFQWLRAGGSEPPASARRTHISPSPPRWKPSPRGNWRSPCS